MEQIKPDKRFLIAEEDDLNLNLSLKTNFNDVNDFNNTRIISLSELFTKERNKSTKYRIYGNINSLSFIKNKKTNPSNISDFFNDDLIINGFNFEKFFELKILRPTTIQTYKNDTSTYIESLTAVTNINDYDINFFTYGKNIYNEKIYNFKFNVKNFNPNEIIRINNLNPNQIVTVNNDFVYNNSIYLGFIPKNFPFIYTLYEKTFGNDYVNELNSGTTFGYVESAFTSNTNNIINKIISNSNPSSNFTIDEFKKYFLDKLKIFFKIYDLNVSINNIEKNIRFIRNYLDIGNSDYTTKKILNLDTNIFEGNFIFFDRENYNFNEILKKEYLIKLQLVDTYQGFDYNYNKWKNEKGYTGFSFTETNISVGGNFIVRLSIDFYFKFNPFYKIELKKYDSVIDEIFSGITTNLTPPQTAVAIGERIIWKDLLQYGDAENYDNPFINNVHYFFNDINFFIKPDLSDKNTFILINEFLLNFSSNNFKFNKNNINLVRKEDKAC